MKTSSPPKGLRLAINSITKRLEDSGLKMRRTLPGSIDGEKAKKVFTDDVLFLLAAFAAAARYSLRR